MVCFLNVFRFVRTTLLFGHTAIKETVFHAAQMALGEIRTLSFVKQIAQTLLIYTKTAHQALIFVFLIALV